MCVCVCPDTYLILFVRSPTLVFIQNNLFPFKLPCLLAIHLFLVASPWNIRPSLVAWDVQTSHFSMVELHGCDWNHGILQQNHDLSSNVHHNIASSGKCPSFNHHNSCIQEPSKSSPVSHVVRPNLVTFNGYLSALQKAARWVGRPSGVGGSFSGDGGSKQEKWWVFWAKLGIWNDISSTQGMGSKSKGPTCCSPQFVGHQVLLQGPSASPILICSTPLEMVVQWW